MPPSREQALNAVISEVFRLNGEIIAAGDGLTRPLGLSSARWQVMGAIALGGEASVAELARRIGVSRQAVLRIVTEMATEGRVKLVDNPADRRARNIALTGKGRAAYEAAGARWSQSISATRNLPSPQELAVLRQSLTTLRAVFQAIGQSSSPFHSDA